MVKNSDRALQDGFIGFLSALDDWLDAEYNLRDGERLSKKELLDAFVRVWKDYKIRTKESKNDN